MWDKFTGFLQANSRFVVTTHVHPDGDALGSQIGIACVLARLGKTALMLNQDPVPRVYRFLDPEGRIRTHHPDADAADIASCDAAIVIDVATLERTGTVGDALRAAQIPIACVDHHTTNEGLGDLDVIVPDAASSSSLVLDLMRTLGQRPDATTAEALYTGLATDTGWFRYANATPQAFRDAAELVQRGAFPPLIYELVYENLSWARTRLLARALATLKSEADGRIAYVTITRQMFEETGAADEEVEGFIDKLRELGGVEIIVMFRQAPDGTTKVSLRAKHDLDVGSLAARFGGGGHKAAAGITMNVPLAEAIPPILAAARELLKA